MAEEAPRCTREHVSSADLGASRAGVRPRRCPGLQGSSELGPRPTHLSGILSWIGHQGLCLPRWGGQPLCRTQGNPVSRACWSWCQGGGRRGGQPHRWPLEDTCAQAGQERSVCGWFKVDVGSKRDACRRRTGVHVGGDITHGFRGGQEQRCLSAPSSGWVLNRPGLFPALTSSGHAVPAAEASHVPAWRPGPPPPPPAVLRQAL